MHKNILTYIFKWLCILRLRNDNGFLFLMVVPEQPVPSLTCKGNPLLALNEMPHLTIIIATAHVAIE
jgi:hypothetical protein